LKSSEKLYTSQFRNFQNHIHWQI